MWVGTANSHQPSRTTPCDHVNGPCGWEHRELSGPRVYYIDGQVVTESEYDTLMDRLTAEAREASDELRAV